MGVFLGLIGVLGFIVALVGLIMGKLLWMKDRKQALISMGAAFALFVVGVILTPPAPDVGDSTPVASTEQSTPQSTDRASKRVEEPSTDVSLTLDAKLDGRLLTITGDATVPNGSLLAYEITIVDKPCSFCMQDGQIEVTNGKYSAEVDLSEFEPGELSVWVAFQTLLSSNVKQPDTVVELFGEMGEHMTGPDVVQIGSLRRVEKEVILSLDGEPEPASQPVSVETSIETAVKETVSQRNAIRSAQEYLRFMAFSKSGLIEQLEFEGFSREDATYAVNQINVDWYEQAVKSAEEYLNFMAFSKSGLIEQLMFEGFTAEEAAYAVTQVGFD